jgi:ribonuclease III
MKDRAHLETLLQHKFADAALLDLALTHRSATVNSAVTAPEVTNERLEFLGDRVLGLAIASLLYQHFPHEPEGSLTRRFAALVRRETLSQIAGVLSLQEYIQVGGGDDAEQQTASIAADACEALIGAVYVDAGYKAAEKVIVTHWQPLMEAEIAPPKDAKTALQELAQGRGLPLPEYTLVESSGPDHSPEFTMAVAVKGYDPVQGRGASKRIATQAAAAAMLERLL